jgi:hypothetical protein
LDRLRQHMGRRVSHDGSATVEQFVRQISRLSRLGSLLAAGRLCPRPNASSLLRWVPDGTSSGLYTPFQQMAHHYMGCL